MATRQPPRPLPLAHAKAATPDVVRTAENPAAAAPDAVAAHLAQGETALAAATLLPLLDEAAGAGHAASRAAASVIRALTAPRTHDDPGPVPGDDHLAAALARLMTLLRQQDAQMAQMQAMLEALL